jgi:hypothetical protein
MVNAPTEPAKPYLFHQGRRNVNSNFILMKGITYVTGFAFFGGILSRYANYTAFSNN